MDIPNPKYNLYEALLEALAPNATIDPYAEILQKIVNLHSPSGKLYIECGGDDFAGYIPEAPEYPCRTIELIRENILPDYEV